MLLLMAHTIFKTGLLNTQICAEMSSGLFKHRSISNVHKVKTTHALNANAYEKLLKVNNIKKGK